METIGMGFKTRTVDDSKGQALAWLREDAPEHVRQAAQILSSQLPNGSAILWFCCLCIDHQRWQQAYPGRRPPGIGAELAESRLDEIDRLLDYYQERLQELDRLIEDTALFRLAAATSRKLAENGIYNITSATRDGQGRPKLLIQTEFNWGDTILPAPGSPLLKPESWNGLLSTRDEIGSYISELEHQRKSWTAFNDEHQRKVAQDKPNTVRTRSIDYALCHLARACGYVLDRPSPTQGAMYEAIAALIVDANRSFREDVPRPCPHWVDNYENASRDTNRARSKAASAVEKILRTRSRTSMNRTLWTLSEADIPGAIERLRACDRGGDPPCSG